MNEEIGEKTIALTVKASKLTARTLSKILGAAARQIKAARKGATAPHGRQSVKKLMNHGAATNSIPLDGDTALFDRVARKWNVDYSFHKTGPEKYLLFFKSGQADAITACFADYTRKYIRRANDKREPIREQLDRNRELVKPEQRERTRAREAARDGR